MDKQKRNDDESTKLYSVAGLITSDNALENTRAFLSPHYTVSTATQAAWFSQPMPDNIINFSENAPPHPADVEVEAVKRHRSARPLFCNAQMGPRELCVYCTPSDQVMTLLRTAIQQLGLSARAYDRLLKVSRTIADLEGAADIEVSHVAESIQYRSLDRKFWGV